MTVIMIQLSNVSLSRNHKQIFSDFNFAVAEGEKRLIIGSSGKGKTSLLKLILGFEQPDQGDVRINRLSVTPSHIHSVRDHLFYLSQDVDLPNETLTTFLDGIFLPETDAALSRRSSEVNEWFSFFELDPSLLQQQCTNLSGGERQRVGLIVGLLLDRPVWLLDEPTAALDQQMKEKVVSTLLDTNKTMIIVSHDAVWQKPDRVIMERW